MNFIKQHLPESAASLAIACLLAGCEQKDNGLIQGYVEGEFVYVASPSAGAMEKLAVQRGDQVEAGGLLYKLQGDPEQTARDEAQRRLAQAKANLEDARKGKRPTEIASLTAQLGQAKAASELSQ